MGRKAKKRLDVFLENDDLLDEKFPDGRMNVSQYVARYNNDEGFTPVVNDEFVYTDAAPGTPEKLRVLAYRVRRGLPIFHPLDRQKGGKEEFWFCLKRFYRL